MCEVLQVSRAGFYRWRGRPPSRRMSSNAALMAFLLKQAKAEHRIPGYRKLWQAAMDQGYQCSQNRVQRLLQAVGYRSCTARKPGYRKPMPNLPQPPNLLNREFTVLEKTECGPRISRKSGAQKGGYTLPSSLIYARVRLWAGRAARSTAQSWWYARCAQPGKSDRQWVISCSFTQIRAANIVANW